MLPRWVRSLDDYWSWFAEQLDYSGARLEDDSVQVQIVADEATGERLALILGRQRVIFHGGSWLEFGWWSTGRLPRGRYHRRPVGDPKAAGVSWPRSTQNTATADLPRLLLPL